MVLDHGMTATGGSSGSSKQAAWRAGAFFSEDYFFLGRRLGARCFCGFKFFFPLPLSVTDGMTRGSWALDDEITHVHAPPSHGQ